MYGLYGWLLAKGQIAFLNMKFSNPDFVGIYPEIMPGNDMGAATIVRYILAKPGIMGTYINGVAVHGPETFDKTDKVYYFSRVYAPKGVDSSQIMFLPILNLHIFKDQKRKRTKTCYLVGKGFNQAKHPPDAIEITRPFAEDQQALADLFNECREFYCYDFMTAQTEIARLCGCPVRYWGNCDQKELSLYEPGLNGLTYKDEEPVPLYTDVFREHYLAMIKEFERKLDIFIEETQR